MTFSASLAGGRLTQRDHFRLQPAGLLLQFEDPPDARQVKPSAVRAQISWSRSMSLLL